MRFDKLILFALICMWFIHCASQNSKSQSVMAMDHCQSLPTEKVAACWESYLIQQAKTNPNFTERCQANLSLAEFYSGGGRRDEAKRIYETLLKEPPSAECNKWATIGYKSFIDLSPGNSAPRFQAVAVDGQNFEISQNSDKATIVFFWASWCGACKKDIEDITYIQQNFANKVKIIGISGDSDKAMLYSAIEANRITWPNIIDGNDFEGPINKLYSIHQYPTIVVINHQGKIIGDRYRFESLRRLIKAMK